MSTRDVPRQSGLDQGILGSEVTNRLRSYAELIRRWAPKLDLLADGDLDRLEERHMADSLRLLPLVSEGLSAPAIDVGSGAGLPGVPLAIAQPDRVWRLLEPRKKRAAFLEEVLRELDLATCEVIARSAQEAAGDPQLAAAHAYAVARALAPPKQAFELMQPLVRPGGYCLVMVGKDTELPPQADCPLPGIARLGIPTSGEGPG